MVLHFYIPVVWLLSHYVWKTCADRKRTTGSNYQWKEVAKLFPLSVITINSSVSFHTVTNLNFSGFTFFHILKAYVRIYQLAKFWVLILINLWIIADSNSVKIVLSPLEKLRSVLNPAPRACAQGVSASCSHRRAYKSNTLNAVSYRTKPK